MSNSIRVFVLTILLLFGGVLGATVHADDGDNARFVSGTFPPKTIFTPGEAAPITLVVQNSGETSWDGKCHTIQDNTAGAPSCSYVLVPMGATQEWASAPHAYWSPSSTVLLHEQTSIALQAFRAPSAEGVYRLQWQMVKRSQAGDAPFGEPIPSIPIIYTVSSTPLQDKASVVSVSVPSQTVFSSGESVPMKISFKNTGTHDWVADYYALTQTDRGTYYPVTTDVGMGDTYQASFSFSVPTALGRYERQWRMVSRAPGQEWSQATFFGDSMPSPAVVFTVIAGTDIAQSDNAQYVEGAVPTKSLFVPGEEVSMTIRMKNTGTSTWDDHVKLVALWPVGYQPTWDTKAWSVSGTVAPNQQATFDLKFTAPGTLTTTVLQWRLAKVNGGSADGYFGERAPATPLQWTVASATSAPPLITISQLTGPSSVRVGEQRTWKVSVSDVLGRLSEVSFAWGDGDTNSTPLLSDNTFSLAHTYHAAGTFQIVATAVDNKDASRKTQRTFTVVVEDTKNDPPVIKKISGPTTLKINQRGVWLVNALDTENSPLVYSVEWGDASSVANQTLNVPPTPAAGVIQTATFKHYFTSNGSFPVRFVVKDASGQSVDARVNVIVQANELSAPVMGNGSLIKSPQDPAVYWIVKGKKQHIANESVFIAHAFHWQDIHVVAPSVIASYPTGPDMSR